MSRYKYQGTMKDGNGRVIGTATTSDGSAGLISVYLAGTTTPASIYVLSTGGYAVNSVLTNEHGYFFFWIDDTVYSLSQEFKLVFSHADFRNQEYDDVRIFSSTGTSGSFGSPASKTIASGIIDASDGSNFIALTGEGDTTDTATEIQGVAVGDEVIFKGKASLGYTITLTDGTYLKLQSDFLITSEYDNITLICTEIGTHDVFMECGRASNG